MKKYYLLILFLSAVLFLNPAFAKGTYTGKIIEIGLHDDVNDNVAWVRLDSDITTPACSDIVWFAIDLDRRDMKLIYASLMVAYSIGTPVRIGGTGECLSSWGETYEYLESMMNT